jgi:hypothetical protein
VAILIPEHADYTFRTQVICRFGLVASQNQC